MDATTQFEYQQRRQKVAVAQSVLASSNASQAAKDAANAVIVAYLTDANS